MRLIKFLPVLAVFFVFSCLSDEEKLPVDKVLCDQPVLSVNADGSEQAVLRIRVYSPQNYAKLSHLKVTTTGSDDLRDIEKIGIYYTGKSDVFSDEVMFGNYAEPMDVVNFKGNLNLSKGLNYLWVTYVIPDQAKEAHYVDASCTELIVLNKLYTVNKVSDPHRLLIEK